MTTLNEQLASTERDLWLARLASKWGDNSQRIVQLQAKLGQLQREREEMYRSTSDFLAGREQAQGVTRSWLVPMGMDEYIGRGENFGFLVDNNSRRVRPLY